MQATASQADALRPKAHAAISSPNKPPKAKPVQAASEYTGTAVWAPGESAAAVDAARAQLKEQTAVEEPATSKTPAAQAANEEEPGCVETGAM